jgi:uncharacterized protein YcsI (UPF0317 family)
MPERSQLSTPSAVREACRNGQLRGQTSGLAPGFAQANLVVLPREWAFEFLLYCQRNPKPCPVLEVTEPGDPVPHQFAPAADLRTDLPSYRVWRNGAVSDEVDDITDLWRDDFVAFLIGCSFTFEAALMQADIPVRHVELGTNVPMYRTNVETRQAGPFRGSLVVSMRPLAPAHTNRAVEVTGRFPRVHGAPVHLGDPRRIGIDDLSQPDFGDPVPVQESEIPVFWACGVTPQSALENAALPLAITHAPGCMFVSDVRDEALATE